MKRRKKKRRKVNRRPELTIAQILAWADQHHHQTDEWPGQNSGAIVDAPSETWKGIQMALFKGHRGLQGGSSLAKLLEEKRGLPNQSNLPVLSQDQILAWRMKR